ncbi:MAG: DUF5011 domain-containing protein [Epsilonproteobacteria bacterium]|nr:DUF5011 domain-containing protein [Campylobacterota bacterium]
MREIKFFTLSTVTLLILNGCGGGSATNSTTPTEENSQIQAPKNTITTRALGVSQEWQKVPVTRSWSDAATYCDTLILEGNSDWRLPTSKEFFALLDNNQSIDAHFPQESEIKEFWSATETAFDANKAWKIAAWSNSEYYADKNSTLGVRCVRGEVLPAHSFTQETESLKDSAPSGKELLWQDDADTTLTLLNYTEANSYCTTKDQRLPTIFELQNVINKENLNNPFSYVKSDDFTNYWSITPQPTNDQQILTVNFATGGITFSTKTTQNYVRCVETLDTTAPVITILGDNPMTINQHAPFTDPLATAVDNIDGDLTVESSGTVDTATIGTYTITYTATDTAGNSASEIRTVTVIDVTAPTITLDQFDTYTELGATATDAVEGAIAVTTSGSVDTTVVGTHIVTYTAVDNAGNSTSQNRTITILDKTAPVITLNGSATLTLNQNESYIELGATATDAVDGNVDVSTTGFVNTLDAGIYMLTYTAVDSAGNSASTTRTINVLDTTPPMLTLTGSNPQTILIGEAYTELGAIATDNVDGEISDHITIDSSNVDTNTVGDYSVTYSIADTLGNLATLSRTVSVVDTTIPIITIIGENPQSIEVGTAYVELGASAIDSYDGNITTDITITHTVDVNTLGNYTVTYNVSDSSANPATTMTRDVYVVDTTAPIITLQGTSTVEVVIGSVYSDAGATATDNYDGNLTASITVDNPVNTSTLGTYTITYNVSDTAGLSAIEVSRTVTVITPPSLSFTPHVVTTNAVGSEWLELADLNGDGYLDVLSAAAGNGSKVAWYENSGDHANFTEHILDSTANQPESIRAVDMNNDTYLDILYSTYDPTQPIVLCTNSIDTTFSCNTLSGPSNISQDVSFIEIADLNDDDQLDLFTTSWGEHRIDWYENIGGTNFSDRNLIDGANVDQAISLKKADFNKDGYIDIVAASYGENRIDWYENDGNGAFTPHFVSDSVDQAYSVDVADINNDGYDDIISTGHQNNKIYWHEHDGSTSPNFITQHIVVNDLKSVYYASGVDMDNDGDIDILSASSESNGKIVWYENSNNGANFQEHIIASNEDNVIRVFATDIDNDGNIDIIAGRDDGTVTLYENNANPVTTKIAQTGQTVIALNFDDGYYQSGAERIYSRDDDNEIVNELHTGLMWQDDNDAATITKDWDEAVSYCNTLNLGNYSDWRLPNGHELYYLTDKSEVNASSYTDHFNHIVYEGYWSNTTEILSFSNYVSFNHSVETYTQQSQDYYVRCVRGDPLTFTMNRDASQEVVIDQQHALMWQDDSDASTVEVNFTDAINYCETLNLATYDDWRLPNANELYSTIDHSQNTPANHEAFVNVKYDPPFRLGNKRYWSSTKRADSDQVYTFEYDHGHDYPSDVSTENYLRCVREIN